MTPRLAYRLAEAAQSLHRARRLASCRRGLAVQSRCSPTTMLLWPDKEPAA
jgi:hypothetical protein